MPNATRSVTSMAGSCTTSTAHTLMDDDPQSPTGDWCVDDDNSNNAVRIQFASPTGSLSTGTDAQQFELYVRRDAATSPGNGTPNVAMDAYDDTSLIESGDTPLTLTSDSGESTTESWTSNTSDGSNIEVDIVCTAAGGGPNKRSCDYDAVRWYATLATGERMMVIGEIKPKTRRTK
jgi:hypothetical protein